MSRRSNFNDAPAESHRAGNFERRLRETMDSELEPEMVTPNTAGSEELDYDSNFPLIDQFRQTNMRPARRRGRTSDQAQDGNR